MERLTDFGLDVTHKFAIYRNINKHSKYDSNVIALCEELKAIRYGQACGRKLEEIK